MSEQAINIVAARRTPMGAFQGELGTMSATDLSAVATAAAIADAGIDASEIDEVLIGCVLPAGLGQAPARQAALAAGVPVGIPCTTDNADENTGCFPGQDGWTYCSSITAPPP